jgi:cell division protein FtsW
LIVVFLIAVLQKDLGQVAVMGAILFFMLIFSGRSYKIFISLLSFAIIGVFALIIFFPHRMSRILSWWSSIQDSILNHLPAFMQEALRVEGVPKAYQVSNSLNAMHNGGWFGVGLGNGNLKLGFLSEVHTDFVLAGITEEIGFVGLVFILIIMLVIISRILNISLKTKNPVYHLFALGVGIEISSTFVINSYGISGMIPIKGLAVPFLSYGGSSLLALSIAIGLVLSISRFAKTKTSKE